MLTFEELPVEAVIVATVDSTREHYSQEGKKSCFSDDGIAPASGSTDPKAKKCSVCFNNQWGSRITSNGKRGKNCSEFSKLSLREVSTPQLITSLRVPSASLKAFRAYVKQITTRGEQLNRVVTLVDTTQDRRSTLTFKVIRFVDDNDQDVLSQPPSKSAFAVTDGYTQ